VRPAGRFRRASTQTGWAREVAWSKAAHAPTLRRDSPEAGRRRRAHHPHLRDGQNDGRLVRFLGVLSLWLTLPSREVQNPDRQEPRRGGSGRGLRTRSSKAGDGRTQEMRRTANQPSRPMGPGRKWVAISVALVVGPVFGVVAAGCEEERQPVRCGSCLCPDGCGASRCCDTAYPYLCEARDVCYSGVSGCMLDCPTE